jgi:hypothetical protein
MKLQEKHERTLNVDITIITMILTLGNGYRYTNIILRCVVNCYINRTVTFGKVRYSVLPMLLNSSAIKIVVRLHNSPRPIHIVR